ncbi:large subunit ribosomal protein L15 [Cryobacterium mesophilum]|uniref:Large ribosomal subunit protein uL15 n=1 Tax=Terrimesophilobacter mesophilus TaxID=433647 RepID=A0A4R8VC42_9MICO|nr:50S ribosomal protein L15 [Terrimesophilobacter mesophilus]MBB5632908.1 large subunit ribosomal protein L15 [Terrimesophilobacter mesophilus]TFB79680.1 50S ribosomal protein L15 [Terrimesophilobacter mesophilus]
MADEAEKKKPAAKAAPKTAASKDAAPKAAASKAAAPKAAAKPAAAKSTTAKDAAAKPAAKAAASKTAAAKAEPKAAASKSAAGKAPAAKAAAAKAPAAKAASKDVVSRPQVLKMHHLRPAPGAKTAKTRVGRGEASKGKTAGRGTKGTKARYQVRVGLEGGNLNSVMRTPKLRGFKNPFRVEYQVVNLERLAELYPKGGDVTVSDLVAKGAVRKNEKVKVLGAGEIDVKLNVAVDKISGSAEQKILAAGGSVK